jgi:hypothetical protein
MANPQPKLPSPADEFGARARSWNWRRALSPTGSMDDAVFRGTLFLSALVVLLIVASMIVAMYSNSRLSINEFGWGFLTGREWNPVRSEFGALPFIYGTLMSSHRTHYRRPALARRRHLPCRTSTALCSTPRRIFSRTSGFHSFCRLRPLGNFCTRFLPARVCRTVLAAHLRLATALSRHADRDRVIHGHHPGHHDYADYLGCGQRRADRRARLATRSGARAWRNPLGNDSRRAGERFIRYCWRYHSRFGPSHR